jgi:hypothetical protein
MVTNGTIEERVKDYERLRAEALVLYKAFGAIECPALGNELIYFTAKGFNHLIYPRTGTMRDVRAQILRFDMLPRAKEVLAYSTTFQEYDEAVQHFKIKRKGREVTLHVVTKYWGFVAIIGGFRVKVVVRQQGNGKKEFFSVVPAWFTKQYRNIRVVQNSTGLGLAYEDDMEVLKNATQDE